MLRGAIQRTDIPVDLTIYAKKNNLLEEDGWKKLKHLVNQSKLTERLVKQAKLKCLKSPRNLSIQRNWIRRMAI